ncbi:MAG: DUF1848 domain-containing protein [Candidatus Omnitrophica bacterium]|nr:DUF1848 domain-containing protein [Candidatus Omnitrophota bacterium]
MSDLFNHIDKNSPAKIISVSRRTDIPAFYTDWFINRIRAGFCEVANPFNPQQIAKVSLKPEDVIAFVFWTRNPEPLMKYLPELDEKGYKYYFLYTITGYPKPLEKSSPTYASAIKTFQKLSENLGAKKVIWRYDPLILSNLTPVEWHIKNINNLINDLSGYTERMMLSIVEPYKKTTSRLKNETNEKFILDSNAFTPETYYPIFEHIGKTAQARGITPMSCAQKYELGKFGIEHGSCIDQKLINNITGKQYTFTKDPNQREFCQCAASKDIGAPNSCLFGCPYCYATISHGTALKNFAKHDKKSTKLL